jgi:hypothetical protein
VIGRRFLVVVIALLVAAQVIRNAAVDALAEFQPQLAAKAWPGHPDVDLSMGMVDIATAMRDRKPVDSRIFRLIDEAATKAPLSPQPFLVRGVQAQIAGNAVLAEQAFVAAQRRDPRSVPAAYFLADHYFRSGDAVHGLDQVVILARLSPNGVQSVAPYVAAYAQDRSTWPQIRKIFRSEPMLEDAALAVLAQNPANADAILALADQSHRNARSFWLTPLLASLVKAGQYGRARAIWASVSRVRLGPGTLLYDGDFSASEPSPPFNWELASSTVGLAERQPGGRLHAMFYGQEDGVLARQLLVLPPGTYRMSLRVAGNPKALSWTVRCTNAQSELGRVPLGALAAHGWEFQVPAGCAAQWLELSGASSDMPQESDVTISALRLGREGGGA